MSDSAPCTTNIWTLIHASRQLKCHLIQTFRLCAFNIQTKGCVLVQSHCSSSSIDIKWGTLVSVVFVQINMLLFFSFFNYLDRCDVSLIDMLLKTVSILMWPLFSFEFFDSGLSIEAYDAKLMYPIRIESHLSHFEAIVITMSKQSSKRFQTLVYKYDMYEHIFNRFDIFLVW